MNATEGRCGCIPLLLLLQWVCSSSHHLSLQGWIMLQVVEKLFLQVALVSDCLPSNIPNNSTVSHSSTNLDFAHGTWRKPVLALWDAWVLFNKRFYHLLWLFVASGQRLGSSSLSRKHASMSYLSIICAFQALLPGCLFLFVCFFVSIFNRFVCPFHSCQLQLCFLSIFPTWPKVPRALPLLSWSAEGLWKGLFFGATPVGEGDSLCVYIETYSIYYRYMYTYILKNRCMYISEVRCASQGRQQKGIFAAVDDRKNYFSANTTSNILDLPE